MHDVAIIGAGPGGFDAAMHAHELGFKVALIEKSSVGGTCLNTGCIPTKALLAASKLLTQIKNAQSFGISVTGLSWDLQAMTERKNRIVETLGKGMGETLRRLGIERINGAASFASKNKLSVTRDGKTQEIEARFILIAAGSEPAPFPGVPFDGKKILSSTDLLESQPLPKSLLILGGGVVGVEFASIFQPLGVKITIVEMLERLLFNEDEEVGRRFESLFRRKGIEVLTGEKVKGLFTGADSIAAILESGKKIEAERVLVAIGRRPRLESLTLEKAGIRTVKGAIEVNEFLETSASGVFAIGDVTNRTTGLAHAASAEGIRVVENLKGPAKRKMDYTAIPSCIYTDPEVASVGVTSSSRPILPARAKLGRHGQEALESKVLFSALGKSQVEGETEGFIKMIAAKKDGRILGVTGIGGRMTELVAEAALAVRNGLTVKALAQTVHAHPTESEILQKAAERLLRLMEQ